MKKLIITLCFLLFAGIANASVSDTPHNYTNNMACNSCHSYSFWWSFSPSNNETDSWSHMAIVDAICNECHGDVAAIEGPYAPGHVKTSMGEFHNPDIDPWSNPCTNCHDPHFQNQLNWAGSYADNLFLVTGTISTIWEYEEDPVPLGVTPWRTEIKYSQISPGINSMWDNSPGSLDWADKPEEWVRKTFSQTGETTRGLILALPSTQPELTFEIISVDPPKNEIEVRGRVPSSFLGASFGLFYGGLIRDDIQGRPVKFFNPAITYNSGETGGYADSNSSSGYEGVCQVCHTLTENFTYDNQCRNDLGEVITCSTPPDEHNASPSALGCNECHIHTIGFAAEGHPVHEEASGYNCSNLDCHGTNNPPMMSDNETLANTGVCFTCHNDGYYGAGTTPGQPNVSTYKTNWESKTFKFGCFGCHKGWPDKADDIGSIECDDARICHDCHSGETTEFCTSTTCASCHDGTGDHTTLPAQDDMQRKPVGMETDGHGRLVSTKWIRMYPCQYCHAETVDTEGNLIPGGKHLNSAILSSWDTNSSAIDVVMATKWKVNNEATPYYTDEHHPPNTGAGETADSCYFTYCHSDGTSVAPVMKSYPWSGGSRECNACHSHDLTESNCDECHTDQQWAPEDRWLSAMPMYENKDDDNNTIPAGQDGSNSHFRHMFTGLSCDDCHANTVVGACVDCHADDELTGTMTEEKHVDPEYHVDDKTKSVFFKDGGTYDDANGQKYCYSTACHTGYAPQWGGSVLDAVTCKACHGINGEDVDDFGAFNGERGQINLIEWGDTGHGKESGSYISGNPAANLGQNGCWYCHDNKVLHQNEERPYRLIQHTQYKDRFEKECVFCHMTELDVECLGCHDAPESLAPQINNIGYQPGINPPYTIERTDHSVYTGGGCGTADCHISDETRHHTGAGSWSQEQKDDVKNSYVQMGVCLKCHDDDSSGECNSCHTGPQYDRGFDPGLPGTGMKTPVMAKASSFHFGHKHYEGYMASLNVENEDGQVSDTSLDTAVLIDVGKNWSPNQWYGYYVKIFDGENIGEVRFITGNTSDTLTVDPAFPFPFQASNLYRIQVETGFVSDNNTASDQVKDSSKNWVSDQWKGYSVKVLDGPNSDQVKRIVGNSTDTLTTVSQFNTPFAIGNSYKIAMPVWKGGKFCWDCHDPHGDQNLYMIQNKVATRTDGLVGKPLEREAVSFTEIDNLGESYAKSNPPYDGICNVCHTEGSQHYAADRGDTHQQGRICTECHEHRFTDSHSDNQPCNSCHEDRPVPRHSGFGQPRDCTKCHQGVIGDRVNIMGQFAARSHHIQGVEITNKHCYTCHWEANEYGLIDPMYHQGYDNKSFGGEPDKEVDLVIWNGTSRPTTYILGETATQFTAKDMGISLAKEREEVTDISAHCLGCHSDLNNNTTPFDDCKTPRHYAWDGSSVADRYDDNGTTTWGKYPTTSNAAKKNIPKAFSAHGNASGNAGGFNPTTGLDDTIPNTRNGTNSVQCFDCHNSHGSNVSGITSSYYSFNGDQNGANLKETQENKGGYTMTYYASSYTNPASVNYYEAGAGQCFDCHETRNAGVTPWGFESTFGAEQPVMGYTDTLRFGEGARGVGARYPYKSSTIMGGHMKASSSVDTAPLGQINGLCTPCHDPHGVSKSLGNDRAYGVPLLKGTWMTSPYKEDASQPEGVTGPRAEGGRYSSRLYGSPNPTPIPFIYTDQKTFGAARITEGDQKFAGLCLRCHPKNSLTDGTNNNGAWKSVDRVHESVSGWGDNAKHSFSCSKCHLVHNSTLPRLMQTNCLNTQHRGRVRSGGAAGASTPDYTNCSVLKSYVGSFPYGMTQDQGYWGNYGQNCHPGASWPDNTWNEVTPWTEVAP